MEEWIAYRRSAPRFAETLGDYSLLPVFDPELVFERVRSSDDDLFDEAM